MPRPGHRQLTARRLLGPALVVLVLAVVVAGLVWFLSGDPDDDRNTSGFAPPVVTRASFCQGVDGFQADFASLDPGADPAAYVAQLRTAAQRLRAAGTPTSMPADARAGLTAFLDQILALPADATLAQVGRLGRGGTAAERQRRKALDTYLAQECPPGAG